MLQADRTVGEDTQRFAFDFRVPVRHRDRGFFVATRDELRLLIAAIVDDRLMERAKAGPGVGTDVFNIERSKNIDHEIGAAVFRCQAIDFGRRRRFGACVL